MARAAEARSRECPRRCARVTLTSHALLDPRSAAALLLANGAVNPLITLSSYGSDAAKLRAIAALDQLALNNPAAHEAIAQGGGLKLLQGVQRFGGETLREATADLLRGVEAPDTLTVAVDTASHARQAHQARLKHSKVWRGATPVARAQAPQQMMQSGESTGP